MIATTTELMPTHLPSAAGRKRLLACRGDPLFYADWLNAVFLHFEADPAVLQREVPWTLDLHEGRAFVSTVAFTMRDLRPRFGGRIAALPFRPIATHEFLNVRTYVKHRGEPGIYFLAEWVPNALSVPLGPVMFGLPYRHGQVSYEHGFERQAACGQVMDTRSGRTLAYSCRPNSKAAHQHQPCAAGTLDEFLLERYTAFTSLKLPVIGPLRRLFRIWHSPWPVREVNAAMEDMSLLSLTGKWSSDAKLISAHHSPGVTKVWMSRPHWVFGRNAA